MKPQRVIWRDWLAGLLPVLLAFALLMYQIGLPSYWLDEANYVVIARLPIMNMLSELGGGSVDYHPPLYHILLNIWGLLMGGFESEGLIRILSVMLAIPGICCAQRWADDALRPILGRRAGWIVGTLIAVSALALMYFRMVRYFSLLFTAGVAFTLMFWRWCNTSATRANRNLALLLISEYFFMFADYSSIALVAFANVYAFSTQRRRYRSFFFGQLLVAVMYLPWAATPFLAAGNLAQWSPAVLTSSISGHVLKVVYPFAAFAVGESNFVWKPEALPGFVAANVLAAMGAGSLFYKNRALFWFLAGGLVFSLLIMILMVSTIAAAVPFTAIPTRMIFVLPIYFALVSAGIATVWRRSRLLAAVAAGALLLTNMAGQVNYHAGRNFVNPLFAVPMREVARQLLDRCTPDERIVFETDTLLGFYADFWPHTCNLESLAPTEPYQPVLEKLSDARIVFVSFGRDRTASEANANAVEQVLGRKYRETDRAGFVPQDQSYRDIKKTLLGREDYAFKLSVRRFEKT